MATAHLNIGSNIGDRHALIGQAVAAVERVFNTRAEVSAPFESEPWGFNSANRFINVGVNIDVGNLTPLDVLTRLQQAERSIDSSSHRDSHGAYIDRQIDIDLIAIDDIALDTPRLTLPHPRMHLRPFVLTPMAQLLPSWHHPRLQATPAQLLAALEKK